MDHGTTDFLNLSFTRAVDVKGNRTTLKFLPT
jgi:hypothetical protein